MGSYDREVNQTGKQGRFHFQVAALEDGQDTTLEFLHNLPERGRR